MQKWSRLEASAVVVVVDTRRLPCERIEIGRALRQLRGGLY